MLSLGILIGMVVCDPLECRQAAASASCKPQGDVQQSNSHVPTQIDRGSGHLKQKVDPKYPERARQMRVQGQVVLQVVIDKKGKIKEMKLVSGHPLLAPAAMDAVKHWRYDPFRIAGHKVEVETDIVVNFQLE